MATATTRPVRRRLSIASHVQRDKPSNAGILSVEPTESGIFVTYDAFLLNFEQVAQALEAAGYRLKRSWSFTLKAAWYAFTDENARRNRQAPDGGCCSRPVGIYGDDSNKKR